MDFGQMFSLAGAFKVENRSGPEIVRDYHTLNIMPYGKTVKIQKFEALNFDPIGRKHLGLLKYGDFRALYPDVYPVAEDPIHDYTDDDEVAPVKVITDQGTFRVGHILWFVLTDVITGILKKQFMCGHELLPIEVFFDEKNQWLSKLFNLIGADILGSLKRQ